MVGQLATAPVKLLVEGEISILAFYYAGLIFFVYMIYILMSMGVKVSYYFCVTVDPSIYYCQYLLYIFTYPYIGCLQWLYPLLGQMTLSLRDVLLCILL